MPGPSKPKMDIEKVSVTPSSLSRRGFLVTASFAAAGRFALAQGPASRGNLRTAMALVFALGYRSVAMIVGHDAGAPVASWAALIRPDVFRSIAIMSSPFEGAPSLPFDTANGVAPPRRAPNDDELDAELAKLNPP